MRLKKCNAKIKNKSNVNPQEKLKTQESLIKLQDTSSYRNFAKLQTKIVRNKIIECKFNHKIYRII